MNISNNTVANTCGASKLVRARFGPGMLLEHGDMEQLNSYTRELNRLMFKSLFGCGVICGLEVTAVPKCDGLEITVGEGVALACSGDPIEVPKAAPSFQTNEKFNPNSDAPLWVVLCGAVKRCAPRTAVCSDDDAHAEFTREKEGYEITVVSSIDPPKCICGCAKLENKGNGARVTNPEGQHEVSEAEATCLCADPNLPCYKDHYAGICGCHCDDCSGCDCKCILLARLFKSNDPKQPPWQADYSVRRFIRPVLMRDPQVKPTAKTPATPPEDPAKKMDEELGKTAEVNKQVEERLLMAAEERQQMKEQLRIAAEENQQMKEQLWIATEEKQQLEEQLRKMAEEKTQEEMHRAPEAKRQKPIRK